jgi:hypothetical protein
MASSLWRPRNPISIASSFRLPFFRWANQNALAVNAARIAEIRKTQGVSLQGVEAHNKTLTGKRSPRVRAGFQTRLERRFTPGRVGGIGYTAGLEICAE